jgi:hypothetical protein
MVAIFASVALVSIRAPMANDSRARCVTRPEISISFSFVATVRRLGVFNDVFEPEITSKSQLDTRFIASHL